MITNYRTNITFILTMFESVVRRAGCGIVLWALLQSNHLLAEFNCRASVHLVLQPRGKDAVVEKRHFGEFEAKGLTELEAKDALRKRLLSAKHRARTICDFSQRGLHSCLESKFQASDLGTKSFSVRKKLEEAIEADCATESTSCGEPEESEAACTEIIVPTPLPASGDGAAKKSDEKKDAKKK